MDENELIQALRQGEAWAREKAYQLYAQRLYATACHFLGPRDAEAEDQVQEAFAAAFQGIGSFEGRSSLYTWLNQICVHRCFKLIRSRKRQCATEAGELERLCLPSALGEAAQRDEEALRKKQAERIAAWLPRLKEACRQVLQLRYSEGLSLNAIRERLKEPLGTVAARLARCSAQLRHFAEREKS